jgi:hypothetical protein
MDFATETLSHGDAVQEGLRREGVTDPSERNRRVIQMMFDRDEQNRLARLGGFVPSDANSRYGDADARLSPLQVERRKLERERAALEAERASLNAQRVLPGTPGVEQRAAGLKSLDLRMGRNTASINATHPVDPDRFQRNIPGLQEVAAKIDAMNAHLASMTSAATVNATITDARQDNRQFPVTVSVSAPISVQQAAQVPGALVGAVNNGIKAGVNAQPARMHFEGR